MTDITAETIASGLAFPECPRWREGRLWFSDIYRGVVLRLDPATGAIEQVVEVPGQPAGLGFLPDMDEMMFLMPGLPVLLFVTIVVGAVLDKRGTLGDAGRTVAVHTPLAVIAAALSLAAAGIHFAVIGEHLEEDVLFGVLFFTLGWFQLVWAQVYLIWQRRPVALAAVLVNLGAILVWVMSRTIGLPIGPEAWIPEQVGFPDLLATSFDTFANNLLKVIVSRQTVLRLRDRILRKVVDVLRELQFAAFGDVDRAS